MTLRNPRVAFPALEASVVLSGRIVIENSFFFFVRGGCLIVVVVVVVVVFTLKAVPVSTQ